MIKIFKYIQRTNYFNKIKKCFNQKDLMSILNKQIKIDLKISIKLIKSCIGDFLSKINDRKVS